MQVLVMRERLQLVDAECCVLRGEDERLRVQAERCMAQAKAAESRCSLAEGELLRRSQQEFAQLREVEMELAKLRAAAVASTVPALHIDLVSATAYTLGRAALSTARSPKAIATVAGGMAVCFTNAAARAWVRLYLLAWRALTGTRELVLDLASHCSDSDTALFAFRALALWRLAVQRLRSRVSAVRLADVIHSQRITVVAHMVLRSWHAHIDRISHLVTPLSLRGSIASTPQYHSAIARSISVADEPVPSRPPEPHASALWPLPSPAEDISSALAAAGIVTMAGAPVRKVPAPKATFPQPSHLRLDNVVDNLLDGLAMEHFGRPRLAHT